MQVRVKRVYEKAAKTDGLRVLVDRLWPRGLSKETARVDEWLRDLAPSDQLRQWYHSRPDAWALFRKRYMKELAQPEANAALQKLYALVGKRAVVSLLFASRNEIRNNAVALKELLEGSRKPPTGVGPGGRARRSRSARRSR